MEFFDIAEMPGHEADAVKAVLETVGIRFGTTTTSDERGRRVAIRVKGTAADLARARELLPDLPDAAERLPRGLDRVTAALVVRSRGTAASAKARAWAERVLDRALARVEAAIADPPASPAGDTKGV